MARWRWWWSIVNLLHTYIPYIYLFFEIIKITVENDYLFEQFFRVQEALIKQNRRLPSGRPEKKYIELLQNKFTNIVGTPKWAKLDREKEEDSDDSDNELLKVSCV